MTVSLKVNKYCEAKTEKKLRMKKEELRMMVTFSSFHYEKLINASIFTGENILF